MKIVLIIFTLVIIVNAVKRTILITGSSDGIGRETACQLAKDSDNSIILHGRNASRCADAEKSLKQRVPNAKFSCVVAEFEDLQQVVLMTDKVKKDFPAVNVVLLNAAIRPKEVRYTKNKWESTFQVHVNHLAHFLLALRLKDILISNAPSRIVVTASQMHRGISSDDRWDDFNSTHYHFTLGLYGRSKFWNVLFTDYLAAKLNGTGVTANSLHPGHLQTKVSGWSGWPVNTVKTPAYLATSEKVSMHTGNYYSQYQSIGRKNPLAEIKANQKKLWEYSEKYLKKNNFL